MMNRVVSLSGHDLGGDVANPRPHRGPGELGGGNQAAVWRTPSQMAWQYITSWQRCGNGKYPFKLIPLPPLTFCVPHTRFPLW